MLPLEKKGKVREIEEPSKAWRNHFRKLRKGGNSISQRKKKKDIGKRNSGILFAERGQ